MRRSAPRHVRCVAPGVGGQWHRGTGRYAERQMIERQAKMIEAKAIDD
jgi:hypothetical protein